ncbi:MULTISPECIES: hypothetical protein [unclassified Streptomyces]|uniref:hypothetical protein n=1 Tax=unclassified Streptomyces TaxID=2593676 RepID=UPI0036EB3B16
MGEHCGVSEDEAREEEAQAERERAERIESYYHQSAWDLAERIVDLEDEIGADVDGICTGMHADVAEAHAEIERLRVLLASRLLDNTAEWTAVRAIQLMNEAGQRRDRFRLAWLSARRRAADEANFGMEALERKNFELSRAWTAHSEAQAAWVDAENRLDEANADTERLRAFAADVMAVRGWCMDGEPDCARRFLSAVYDSTYELEEAEREGRPFVDRLHRRAARGEFDDIDADKAS